MKKKVFIWGAGNNASLVFAALDKDRCVILGFIDSNSEKQGTEWCKDYIIYSPLRLAKMDFDYVILSPDNYFSIQNRCIDELGIPKEKVVAFFDKKEVLDFVDYKYREMREISREVRKYDARVENACYEYTLEGTPVIKNALELLERVQKEKCSLCRFGDGEFEMMRMKERPWFQNRNPLLAQRLKEVFCSEDTRVLVAIADNFGSLAHYTEKAADDIRIYLSNGTRAEITKILDFDRVYYDAYVTRPYLMRKDKSWADKVFSVFKNIWKGRKLLIVEGKYGKLGVGNDLFSEVDRIKRIICPEKNAFDVYEEIMNTIREIVTEEELVLISLGPTATVMVYDLAQLGIQAIDIGQIDNEYEWYLKGAQDREVIPGKMVAEKHLYNVDNVGEIPNEKAEKDYRVQIVAEIITKEDRIG